jgi:hypothetical protein
MNFEYEFSLSFVGNLFKRYSAIVYGLGAKIRGGVEVDGGLGDSEGSQDEVANIPSRDAFSFGAKVHKQGKAPKC